MKLLFKKLLSFDISFIVILFIFFVVVSFVSVVVDLVVVWKDVVWLIREYWRRFSVL